MLKCEMDTSAHDINRVYFTTTSDDEDLLFLSPRLFKDEYDEAAVAYLKGRSWKSVKDTDRRNCRKGRTRQTSIMSLGRKNARRILKGF